MASKEKKSSTNNKKPNVTLKDNVNDISQDSLKKSPKTTLTKTPLVKKLAANNVKKLVKKSTLAVKLKTKGKKPVPLNKKLNKTVLKNAKSVDAKQKLLGNGVSIVNKKSRSKKNENQTSNTSQPKKRAAKKVVKDASLEEKKIKIENDDAVSNASDLTDISNVDSSRPSSRTRMKKMKSELPSEDEPDLPFFVKNEPFIKDSDSMTESGKTDSPKSKKNNRKKSEIVEKDIKKVCPDQTVIDSLDLNVLMKGSQPKGVIQKRRHSIEKFPMSNFENVEDASIFTNIPRSISPRCRRNTRIRQSVDGLKRVSPYTRSDSPARILRNGKQRKLKDLNLLGGLDSEIRKRKRHCSDLSELSVSKMSGYESDSSFSDLASLTGAESSDVKDEDSSIKTDSESFTPAVIKRSLSTDVSTADQSNNLIDTNSNLYSNSDSVDINLNDKMIKLEEGKMQDNIVKSLATTPSSKVPEKSILLDIMKQAFNNDIELKKDTQGSEIIPSTNFCDTEGVAKETETENIEDILEKQIRSDGESNINTIEIVNEINEENNTSMCAEEVQVNVSKETESVQTQILQDDTHSAINNVLPEESGNSIQSEVDHSKVQFSSQKDFDYADEELMQLTAELSTMVNGELHQAEHNTSKLEKSNSDNEVSAPLSEEIKSDSGAIAVSSPLKIKEMHELTETKKLDTSEDDVPSLHMELEHDDVPPLLEPVENSKLDNNVKEQIILDPDNQKTEETMPILESVMSDSITQPDSDSKKDAKNNIEDEKDFPPAEESAEEKVLKENILQALGLQSLKAAEEAKHLKREKVVQKGDNYTGTLKTVIKINRDKKKGRNSLKMTLQKNKPKPGESECGNVDDGYKIMKESASTSWKHGTISSDTAGAHRKSHYSNRSNLDGSSEHTSDGETHNQDGTEKALVIPEKASSFSIHPGRLCKDECSYCFGKFGLFDTPCHIAQIKNVERQDKILAAEKHLTRDSCLCDACYRHVDRKSNTPSYTNKSFKRNSMVAPGPRQNHCHVLGCNKVSTNILRRKWIIKMRKSICQVINIDLDNPGLHSIPICDEHYSALEHLMVCAMCKRRLARNHIHYLGPETDDLNQALAAEGIPLTLCDKPVVCKLCKCFAAVILKSKEDRPENSTNFFSEYKKRLLHFNDIVPMDEAAAEEPIVVPSKAEKDFQKKKRKSKPEHQDNVNNQNQQTDQTRVPSPTSPVRPESPDDFNSVDYNTLIPAIAMDCDSDSDTKKEPLSKEVVIQKIPRLESVKEAVEISKNLKVAGLRQSDIAVTKLGSNPSISVRQLFPGEEELPLQAHIDFSNAIEKTPDGWDKCISTIQYDSDTKHLWNELQKPYGNQSSFLRHLILLEKYFRNGDLILSSNASHHAMNYSESVQNRLRAYDNIPSNTPSLQPITMIKLNKAQKSQSGIITSKKDPLPPVTITNCSTKNASITAQLNIPPLIQPTTFLQSKQKNPGAPPGLISLHGNIRPSGPQVKQQSQKIKFPITKNWRPNLIPIDPNKKQEKKQGLVQVISGGKPYHITFEDYKKMCAIKRSFELREKNKRLQEAQGFKQHTSGSVLKTIAPRKGLIISKTAAVVKAEPNETSENETILEKLDKHVENIGSKATEKTSPLMPKIPKSLTVIPQTVARKASRPSSPVLIITQKTSSSKS